MVNDIAVVEPPPLANDVFGSQLDLAMRYVGWLTGAGVERGLVGPRESERIWRRHVLNCVCASALIPPNSSVVDIGSGAGLPGVVLAIARPDLDIVLVESMLRRTTFLDDVVTDLGLSRVVIHRSRAEDLRAAGLSADVVTARAVAPMDRLVGWAVPLLGDNGQLVALKGSGVVDEVAQALAALRSARLGNGRLVAVLPGMSAEGATTFHPGLVTKEQGRWHVDSADAVFRPAVSGGGQSPEVAEADRLALIAVFYRSAKGLSTRPPVGLG